MCVLCLYGNGKRCVYERSFCIKYCKCINIYASM